MAVIRQEGDDKRLEKLVADDSRDASEFLALDDNHDATKRTFISVVARTRDDGGDQLPDILPRLLKGKPVELELVTWLGKTKVNIDREAIITPEKLEAKWEGRAEASLPNVINCW